MIMKITTNGGWEAGIIAIGQEINSEYLYTESKIIWFKELQNWYGMDKSRCPTTLFVKSQKRSAGHKLTISY